MQKTLTLLSCLACACQAAQQNPASAFQSPGMAGTLARSSRTDAAKMENVQDLKKLAMQLNPLVGYYDPLSLSKAAFWGDSNEATIGWFRHAEIKHGRVAMAAFVGYCLQSNGVVFPWKLTGGGVYFKDIAAAGSPPEQWDALPTASKWQILLFVGFLEFWSESRYVLDKEGTKHYMRGGVPGKFPSFNAIPHPVPFNLYDPFMLNQQKTRQELDKSLLAEINNGRLAMLGIMAFVAEQKVPGAAPALSAIGNFKPYAGEFMAPFTESEFWAAGLGAYECGRYGCSGSFAAGR